MSDKLNIVQKIISAHLVSGSMEPGGEIAIRIDQTLTQDATGTMAYLQFESMGVPRVETELSVSYVDHNTLQSGFENADDHRFLASIASKYGLVFSPPGNGICHQLHLERFGAPGKTLLGSDSHTPTGGGIGMIAIGAGGLDVAVAMAGGAFHLAMPKVLHVVLKGKLRAWVSAKDVILELLRRLSVRGGLGRILEFGGPGVGTLSVPERATITNMGAELGATTSVFPSDERTRDFMKAQSRANQWTLLEADPGAEYDEEVVIDLSKLEPMIAMPHSPDNVVAVEEIEGRPVNQVCIGSCTNSSLKDMMTVARALSGKRISTDLDLVILPGSRQVLEMLSLSGDLAKMVAAGARLNECVCGPCIGMGMAPPTDGVTLRTFNRNFEGRSGTMSAGVYLCSPETAVAAALNGTITDPRRLGRRPVIKMPETFIYRKELFVQPSKKPEKVEIVRGPNIVALKKRPAMPASLSGEVILKVGDNITTDHIMPAGAKILPLRSNIPKISEHVFVQVDPGFASRAKAKKGGFIAGGVNYGQGSSREHAALAPSYLGIKAVLAVSFARIHRTNLINFGILPLVFENAADLKAVKQGAKIEIIDVKKQLRAGGRVMVKVSGLKKPVSMSHGLSDRERDIVIAGGLLNYTKKKKSGR
ncbi:MAG TPA: aconitate hydratase [bacterium]|nr:aconitate hydratase [bacterium]